MAGVWDLVHRNWQAWKSPPTVAKAESPLRFGILGAANIGPAALILPAKSHPEVVVQCVAARDEKKAAAYAQKHGIPEVKSSYQAILDDPTIHCVYIPLPNGLHFEWAIKALKAGKHVLLEKPSVSNAAEAEKLFRLPLLSQPDSPVLLEAFHYRFQPSWQHFLTLLDRPNIQHVEVKVWVPPFAFAEDDIRFRYALSGGAMMDLGTYCMSAIRGVFAAEPEECVECSVKTMPPPEEKCDRSFKVKWRMAGGAVAEMSGDLKAPMTGISTPSVVVLHKPTKVEDTSLPTGQEKLRTRTIRFSNFMVSGLYHRIDIEDQFEIRKIDGGGSVKLYKSKEMCKVYKWRDVGIDAPGEDFWFSYRHQLEAFVNRVKGRKTMSWVDAEDSLKQMRMIDMAYEKAGLPLRPTSTYDG